MLIGLSGLFFSFGLYMNKSKLILYGGSFDPIHLAHVKYVEILRKSFPDALILVMPSQNRLKDNAIIPIKFRIEITKIALQKISNVVVVDWTLKWDTSSTYEVSEKIKSTLYPEYELVIAAGEDIVPSLPKWKHFNKLKNLNWVFLKRDNGIILETYKNDSNLKEIIKNAVILDGPDINVSSTQIRQGSVNPEEFIPYEVVHLVKPYLKN